VGEAFTEASAAFYRRAGMDEAGLELVRQRGNGYAARTRHIPATCLTLEHGQELTIGGRTWQVMTGQGHSPDMVCLFCPELELLISGDQILPLISPNVSVWPSEPEADPLGLFLVSLESFRPLPPGTLVLPSHGTPFQGLQRRLDQLAAHHDQRLRTTLAACARPLSAWELLPMLFPRDLDSHQLFFALGESLSHLHCLRARGLLTAEIDAQGVCRFQRRR
jgi:glyoxylase-like metal-dependent hydrolase (beta-lactamase superfamily II)